MKVLLYCTKEKEIWGDGSGNTWWGIAPDEDIDLVFELNPTLTRLNGKIVSLCDCEKVEEVFYDDDCFSHRTNELTPLVLEQKTCLPIRQIDAYLGKDKGYALYLSDVQVFDEPKELNEYGLKRAPQNMCYCHDRKGNEYILISIRPVWLAKILNGTKTIEFRRKVLKELKSMIKESE